ncbi:MAG: energy-coupling factor ABC transporter permease [Thermoplasmata archaeon]|nr:energy-coupling factor ABC transporter permease [Thermoplasmata archaeon]
MAHIHLEDGALSPIWVLFWWAVAAALIAFALYSMRREPASVKRLTVGAMCAAVGIAAFMVTIPVFGVHLNLTPLIGILAGPAVGGIAVLVINLFSAAVGHGGWGVIGVNVVINLIEVMVGYYAYRSLKGSLRIGRFASGFSAATMALVASAIIVVVIIAVAGIQDSHLEEEETAHNLVFIAAANLIMGVIEGFITAYILTFIGKVKPDLLVEVERPRKDSEEAQPSSS